ncbi:hypothetical protein M422DRAFT_52967 [Sphaerobolus stellatus SS14]|uniref:Uncharacterized protein n=1 Tax=Sphaerobolus stellatus (strain SS14) TaxID=990650 RepID=A0A0C9TQ97_SPHS4|nr:hypothetical protein M422DRAFT_52967 [Sphaerobolus stellatus SS14]
MSNASVSGPPSFPQKVEDIILTAAQVTWLEAQVGPFRQVFTQPTYKKGAGFDWAKQRWVEFQNEFNICKPEPCLPNVSLQINAVWEKKIYQFFKNRKNKLERTSATRSSGPVLPLKAPRADPAAELYVQSLGKEFTRLFNEAMEGLPSTQNVVVRPKLRTKLWAELPPEQQQEWQEKSQNAKQLLIVNADAGETFSITHAPDGPHFQSNHIDYQGQVYEAWQNFALEAHAMQAQKERTKTLLKVDHQGYPRLPPGEASWSQMHYANILKAFFDQLWSPKQITAPWAKLSQNPSKYLRDGSIPPDFKFRDPGIMSLFEVATLYDHTLQRQARGEHLDIFIHQAPSPKRRTRKAKIQQLLDNRNYDSDIDEGDVSSELTGVEELEQALQQNTA